MEIGCGRADWKNKDAILLQCFPGECHELLLQREARIRCAVSIVWVALFVSMRYVL